MSVDNTLDYVREVQDLIEDERADDRLSPKDRRILEAVALTLRNIERLLIESVATELYMALGQESSKLEALYSEATDSSMLQYATEKLKLVINALRWRIQEVGRLERQGSLQLGTRILDQSSDISLTFDLSNFTQIEIAEILGDLNAIYVSLGGDELEIRKSEVLDLSEITESVLV